METQFGSIPQLALVVLENPKERFTIQDVIMVSVFQEKTFLLGKGEYWKGFKS
jgi:hypothetical protein